MNWPLFVRCLSVVVAAMIGSGYVWYHYGKRIGYGQGYRDGRRHRKHRYGVHFKPAKNAKCPEGEVIE